MEKAKISDRLIRWGMARPRMVQFVHFFVDRLPPIRSAIHRKVSIAIDQPAAFEDQEKSRPHNLETSPFLASPELSPRAKEIYADLINAADFNRRKGR